MSGSTRKPTVLLSLVKQSGSASRFASLEGLEKDKKDLVQRYQRMIAPGSVLVGAVVSASNWDIRPVILHRGKMSISRIFSPELMESVSLTDAFKSYIFHIEQLFLGTQGLVCGSSEGHAWVTRRYFTHILSDNNLDIPMAIRPKLMHGLLATVEKLHSEGMIHGHINPNNIVYENGRLVLVDHGFQIHDPGSSKPGDLAPELRGAVAGVANATIESDVYGLGLVAKRLFGGELAVEFGNLVEVLLLTDPKLRPKLSQVSKHFAEGDDSSALSSAAAHSLDVQTIEGNKRTKVLPLKSPALSMDFLRGIHRFGRHPAVLASVVLVVTVVAAQWYQRAPAGSAQVDEGAATERFERLWESGQIPLMQQVVQGALTGDEASTRYLRKKFESGDIKYPAIQQKLFVVAFHPFWAEELSDDDIRALMIFGMPSLVPPSLRLAPDLTKVNPAVSFALAATLSPSEGFVPFTPVLTKDLGTLPKFYGNAFLALAQTGIANLGMLPAQSLAHILTDDFSSPIISGFLSLNDTDPKTSFVRLEILQPLYDILPGLSEGVLAAVASDEDHPLAWFSKDVVAGWEGVPAIDRLKTFSGVLPATLSREQVRDLLRFPLSRVREQAVTKSVESLGEPYQKLIQYLASNDCELTRTQTISLFATLSLTPEKARPFALQWFDTNPDPKAVVTILANKPVTQGDDPFTIAAAKYLVQLKFKLSAEQIKALAGNQEKLIRAFAYSQLTIETPEQKKLLNELLEHEPDASLKSKIAKRLAD